MKKYMLFLCASLLLVMISIPATDARPPEGDVTAVRLYGYSWGEVAKATTPSEIAFSSNDTEIDDPNPQSDTDLEESNSIEDKLDLMTYIKIGLIKYSLLLY